MMFNNYYFYIGNDRDEQAKCLTFSAYDLHRTETCLKLMLNN